MYAFILNAHLLNAAMWMVKLMNIGEGNLNFALKGNGMILPDSSASASELAECQAL